MNKRLSITVLCLTTMVLLHAQEDYTLRILTFDDKDAWEQRTDAEGWMYLRFLTEHYGKLSIIKLQ